MTLTYEFVHRASVVLRCAAAGCFLSMAGFPAAAQNPSWVQQFGTSGNDSARAAASDGSGGVYACGITRGSLGGSNAGGEDAWLARYDGAGNQIWIRQLGTSSSDRGYAAAPDGTGGVFVGGVTEGSLGGANVGGEDAWLARYDGAGNQLWIRQLGTSGVDYARAAAWDRSGGVVVCGYTTGDLGGMSSGGEDVWLARFDGTGNQVWIRQFGTFEDDSAWGASPDGVGGVFVGGHTRGDLEGQNAGDDDAWLARYDNAGNQLWVRQLGTSSDDWLNAAARDGLGGVFVSGWTLGSLGGPSAGYYDAWLARFDGAGNQTWIRQLGTTEIDAAAAAALAGSGGVFVGGQTVGSLGGSSAGVDDAWIALYDNAGNQVWIHQLGSSAVDLAYTIAPDGAGGGYLSGWTRGDLSGQNAGGEDIWLARYEGSAINGFCVGDGSGTPCPCGNTGGTGEGCANSSGAGGLLTTAGSNSFAADDLSFTATQLLPSQPALLFVGQNAINGGNGVQFGDGLRCAGGNVVRLGIQFPDGNGDAIWGPGLSTQGGWGPGDVRRFQGWYRDPAGLCNSGFNLTNGVDVTFTF